MTSCHGSKISPGILSRVSQGRLLYCDPVNLFSDRQGVLSLDIAIDDGKGPHFAGSTRNAGSFIWILPFRKAAARVGKAPQGYA